LRDDRFLAEIELELEKQRGTAREPSRPSLEHFTAEVEAMYDISDDIRLLINAIARADLPFRLRPESPLDRIEARKRAIGRAKIAEITGQEVS
jgi:hypothetical protein